MSRRYIAAAILGLFALIGGGAGYVFWSLSQVPEFYAEILEDAPPPEVRKAEAKAFVERAEQLNKAIEEDDAWSAEFTQSEVNGWLAEEAADEAGETYPSEVRDVRVHFTQSRLLVGCRVEQPQWNGVISLALKPSVPAPNRLEIEIESARAGLLPVPLDSVLERVVAALGQNGWQATRRREQGRDFVNVNLERGDTEQPVLESIEIRPGVVRLSGHRVPPAVALADARSSAAPPLRIVRSHR